MKFRAWLARTMAGRYGVDQLNKDLLWVYIALVVISLFVPYVNYLALLVAVWMMFRILSRNLQKRYQENMKYLAFRNKITGWFGLQKRKWNERKTHRYRRCPHCKATVRLPYKKGKHTVGCPRCHQDFQVRI